MGNRSEYMHNYYKARRARLAELGLCTRCGKREATQGMKYCAVCREYCDYKKRKKG